MVWLYVPQINPGQSRKFSTVWRGPYKVIEARPPTNYVVQFKNKPDTVSHVHVSRLKPYVSRETKPTDNPEYWCAETDETSDTTVLPADIGQVEPAVSPSFSADPTSVSTETQDPQLNQDELVTAETEAPLPSYHGKQLYEVERILGMKMMKKKKRTVRQYLVHWKGFPDSCDSWEPATSFRYDPQILQDYHASAVVTETTA